ncbi:MAG: hypothetical protein ACXU8U_01360 [Asticcacaulis sp.]
MQAQTVIRAAMPESHGQVVTASLHPSDLDSARRLIAQVNAHHDLQTAFAQAQAPDPKMLAFWSKVGEAIGRFLGAVGAVFAPLGPVLPYILYLLAFAALALLLSPVVRLFITTRFTRLFARHNLVADAPWRPSRAAVAALLSEIDALAEKGEYDEAVHLLLVRSVADINSFRPDLVRSHYSARDILSHPLLPVAARPAFKAIVEWVERSYFAGIRVGKAGFDACRQAYVDFIRAEGLHSEGAA